MRKITSNTPRRVIIAILAAAMTFSAVSAGITPLCAPVVVYAGNTENNVTIDTQIGANSGQNVTISQSGEVGENTSTGDVDVNNGTIGTNNGNVDENNGTITTNNNTIVDNFGTVVNNAGTITNNYGDGTVGGTAPANQYYSIGVSGENISTSYGSGFTEKKGTQYLESSANESYVTIAPASGYSLNGTETSGTVTNPAGYSYQIFRDSSNSNNFVLMIGTPSGNQVINLSAIGIISQLIGIDPSSSTSSESASSSDDSSGSTQSAVQDTQGIPSGWTPASDTIYRLVEAAHKRAVDQGSSVVMVDLGDNPSFDENAARSLIDKAGSNGSDCIFTVDGKAYNLIIPGGITPEQREALMRLLSQEPGGTAGPMRLVQLLNQVGVNASVKELTGGELFNRIMGVTGSQMNTESQVSAPGSYLYKPYLKLDGYDYSTTNYRVVIQDPDPRTYEKYSQIMSGESVTGPTAGVQGPLMATQPAINPAITGNGEPVTEPTAGKTSTKATSKHVVTLKVLDSQPAINVVVKKNTSEAPILDSDTTTQKAQATGPVSAEGPSTRFNDSSNQTTMEVQTGASSGWTPEAEKIYNLMDAGKKQAINSGSNVVSVEFGDKPNFNENAARSLIDKAASGGSDSMFTVDGKAYNLVVPGGVTVEQREALMKLLAQEPGGTAGPIRLAQLLNQVGVNASVKELNGGDLFNRMMGVTGSQMNTESQVSAPGSATSKHVIALKVSDSEPAINAVIRKNTTEATIPDSDTTTQKAQAAGPISAGGPSTRFNDSNGSNVKTVPITVGEASIPTTLTFDAPQVSISEGQTPASNEKATSKYVTTLKLTDSQPAINPAITGNGEPVTEPTAGVQETTVSQTAMDAQTGTSSGWTPEAEKIYSLMDAGKKQAINSGSNVVSVELGDKPNFNENAARSLIDKAASGGSDSTFTVDGKAYNLVVPGGVTVEQREALMKLLAQEPGGTAGPIRLSQLLNQVGVNATVKELTGGELFNRIMGVTDTTPASSTTAKVLDESPVAKGSYLYKLYYKLDGPDYSRTNYRVVIQDPDPKASEKYKQIMNGDSVTGPTAGAQGPLTATQPAINPAITGNGEPVTGSTAGVQEATVSQMIAEAPNGTLPGWTPEAERIYTLVDTAQKQSIQNGNSVAQVDLGDKPNFDEKATRSFIDKLNTSGADLKFTADGKAYNINVPAGTTVEHAKHS